MSHAKRVSMRKRRGKAMPVLGALACWRLRVARPLRHRSMRRRQAPE